MTPEAYRTAYTAALEEAGPHGPGCMRAMPTGTGSRPTRPRLGTDSLRG
jgi:hypothetical protein